MDTEYDFTQIINSIQLKDEINTAGLNAPDYITTNGNCISIFYQNPLSSQDLSTLTTIVSNHAANPLYIPLIMQTQINTLTGYLNNANPSIVAAARAAIINVIAPNMPLATLTAINATIHSQTGQ